MFRLTINTDNDAFADGEAAREVTRILIDTGNRLLAGQEGGVLHDANGATVGDFDLGPGPGVTPFTMADLHAVSEISDACIHGYHVVRLMPSGGILEGVARCIGDRSGNYLRRDEDVRHGFLRVSGTFEHFWPIRELVPQVHTGEFIIDRLAG
jgi:hypothetical protein